MRGRGAVTAVTTAAVTVFLTALAAGCSKPDEPSPPPSSGPTGASPVAAGPVSSDQALAVIQAALPAPGDLIAGATSYTGVSDRPDGRALLACGDGAAPAGRVAAEGYREVAKSGASAGSGARTVGAGVLYAPAAQLDTQWQDWSRRAARCPAKPPVAGLPAGGLAFAFTDQLGVAKVVRLAVRRGEFVAVSQARIADSTAGAGPAAEAATTATGVVTQLLDRLPTGAPPPAPAPPGAGQDPDPAYARLTLAHGGLTEAEMAPGTAGPAVTYAQDGPIDSEALLSCPGTTPPPTAQEQAAVLAVRIRGVLATKPGATAQRDGAVQTGYTAASAIWLRRNQAGRLWAQWQATLRSCRDYPTDDGQATIGPVPRLTGLPADQTGYLARLPAGGGVAETVVIARRGPLVAAVYVRPPPALRGQQTTLANARRLLTLLLRRLPNA